MKNQITTKNLILRFPRPEDLTSLKAFESRNKIHLSHWETVTELPAEEEYKKRLINWIKECEEGKSARFFIFLKEQPQQLLGMCNFTQIFHGAFRACYLGYKIDAQHEGKGLMFEALQYALKYIFEELHLHRVMANYLPINMRSGKLLNRLGFIIEGYAKNYLLINNRWEDHILTALSYEQWKMHQSAENIPSKQDSLNFREARIEDLEPIIALLYEDALGQKRESLSSPLQASYFEAFSKICSTPNSELFVAELDQKVIGVFQMTYLYHLTFQGSQVALLESVHIKKEQQGKGYGKQMIQWAIEKAKSRGCHRIQLMSDKSRMGAHRFYEQLGFRATHEGMKLFLEKSIK